MKPGITDLELRSGHTFFDYQRETLERHMGQAGPSQRLCLYYRTGAGKTLTALSAVALWGHERAVVIAPPSTHLGWIGMAAKLGLRIDTMSHAKFRMKETKLSRDVAIIADEMHLFGGHGGQGWKKLDALARGLKAPLVLASATPNYNDADRVYCIQHVLDPLSCRGGFLAFLYAHCKTEQNPFKMTPDVTGFLHYKDAAEYLAALPNVEYLPDELVYTIGDIDVHTPMPAELETYGYNRRERRMIASQIEERHTRTFLKLVDEEGYIHEHVYDILTDLVGMAATPVLIYANHSTVAEALAETLGTNGVHYLLVTGKTSKKAKDAAIQQFISGTHDVLVGTASLATGTDGLDKMCDCLIILDDTDDASLRRQLIGRIMPRGADADASKKIVHRLL